MPTLTYTSSASVALFPCSPDALSRDPSTHCDWPDPRPLRRPDAAGCGTILPATPRTFDAPSLTRRHPMRLCGHTQYDISRFPSYQ
jgi:hypothetical protein